MALRRTQIYLTHEEQTAIRQISIRSGTSQSALIRTAIDQYIAQNNPSANSSKRMKAFGLWQDHENLPCLDVLPNERNAH